MQNKFKKYLNLTLIIALIIGSVSVFFTSCTEDDDESDEVVLLSYGPMPIARGGELRFIGKNLDKVSSIVLPDNLSISSFGTHTKELITLTVPQDAQPGLVTIVHTGGEIKTKTPIGYSEPISIAAFSPTTIKPGAELTITGDYLNLVNEVIFTDRVTVAEIVSQSRTELKIIVPEAAQTGKIIVSNGAEDPILVYSSTELKVTLPSITSITPNPVKAGETLTINGVDLDLVTSVELGGSLVVTSFKSKSASKIELTVPETTKDGIVTVYPESGVGVASASSVAMVVPTVSVAPKTLKNGADIIVTGTNLDLISSVVFGGDVAGTILVGGTETEIRVTSPDNAVSGEVKFITKAEKTVSGGNLTFINPVFTSFDPTSAKAKSDITITGTDLDLVTSVVFTGGVEGAVVSQTETQIVVTIPVGSLDGNITLVTKNATEIKSSVSLTMLVSLPNFTSYGEPKATPGEILTINGSDMSMVKSVIFPDDLSADFYSKSDTKIEVYVPKDVARETHAIKIVTFAGDEGLWPAIYIGGTDPVLNQELCFFDFNGTGKDSWWGNAMNSGIVTDVAGAVDGTPYWNINGTCGTGWWDGLFFRNGANNFVTTGVDLTWSVRFDVNVRETIMPGSGVLKIRFGDSYAEFKPWESSADGYKTVGWITVTVPLSSFSPALSSPDDGGKEFGMVWSSGTAVNVNMGIDNVRFEKP